MTIRLTESALRRIIREEATNLMKNKKSLHEMQHHSGRSDDFSHLGMTAQEGTVLWNAFDYMVVGGYLRGPDKRNPEAIFSAAMDYYEGLHSSGRLTPAQEGTYEILMQMSDSGTDIDSLVRDVYLSRRRPRGASGGMQ